MKFQEIVSISGLPGLYQLVATKSDGAIVKNIDDNTTKFVAARKHNVTALDGIEVFTTGENIRLLEVFLTFKKNMESAGEIDINKADNKAMATYFSKLLPEYDKDKVYVSDMKKMVKWYKIVDAKNLVVAPEENATAEEATADAVIEVSNASEPAVTAAPKEKKAKKVKEETEDAAPAEKKPRKKAAPKTEE